MQFERFFHCRGVSRALRQRQVREHAQLAHDHGKHAHAGLPAHQQRLQAAFGAGQIAGKEEVQHFKNAEFQGGGDDRLDILHGDLRAFANVVGQLVHFAAETGQVASGRKGQVGDRLLRDALAKRLEARARPAQKLRVGKRLKAHLRAALFQRRGQLFAPVRLPVHGEDHDAACGRSLEPVEHARRFAFLVAGFSAQKRGPVAHDDQTALAHERQRLGGFDDLCRLRAFERRFIELLQSRGQQGALQRLYRFALEVLLRPGEQVNTLQGVLF